MTAKDLKKTRKVMTKKAREASEGRVMMAFHPDQKGVFYLLRDITFVSSKVSRESLQDTLQVNGSEAREEEMNSRREQTLSLY